MVESNKMKWSFTNLDRIYVVFILLLFSLSSHMQVYNAYKSVSDKLEIMTPQLRVKGE